MGVYLFKMFAFSLILTILLELPVLRILKMRGRGCLLLTVLVNVLTNPAAVLLNWLGLHQLPIEAAVILVEGWIYVRFSKDERWDIPHPVICAVVSNIVSWTAGVLIGGFL